MKGNGMRYLAVMAALALAGCLRPGLDRAQLDRMVGQAQVDRALWQVDGGLATFQQIDATGATLWAQAPDLSLLAQLDAPLSWTLTVRNLTADAVLTGPDAATIEALDSDLPTVKRWRLELPAGEHVLRIAPPDADVVEPFRVAILSDVQSALADVGDIYAVMNRDPSIRYVVSAGDLVEQGTASELEEFQTRLEALNVPFYATPGNHERGAEATVWRDAFGRGSFQFTFKGAWFTFADSSAATIDPVVYGWLKGWLGNAAGGVNLFLTHVPPIDPEGGRNGGWRSRREAAKLFVLLGRNAVDAAVYGHVHSLYSYSNGGVDAWISGGGGALPERLDGVKRHYLTVDIEADRIAQVAMVRVD